VFVRLYMRRTRWTYQFHTETQLAAMIVANGWPQCLDHGGDAMTSLCVGSFGYLYLTHSGFCHGDSQAGAVFVCVPLRIAVKNFQFVRAAPIVTPGRPRSKSARLLTYESHANST